MNQIPSDVSASITSRTYAAVNTDATDRLSHRQRWLGLTESWCDGISSTGIRRPRYRWLGLADWVEAHGLDPGPVGHDLEAELQDALQHVPAARFAPRGSMLAHYGPFPSRSEPANIIAIPYRIYNDPLPDAEYLALPAQQRTLLDCWYSRSHDGHIRQRHLKRLIPVEEHWAIPYVLAAVGDYVIEIVHEAHLGLQPLSEPDSWCSGAYRQFAANNYDFFELMRQRATSYWNCYHSRSDSRTGSEGAQPEYPAFSVLDELHAADSHPRQWRVPEQLVSKTLVAAKNLRDKADETYSRAQA